MSKMIDTSLRVNAPGPAGRPFLNNLRFLASPAFYAFDRLAPLTAGPLLAVTRGNGSVVLARGEAATRQVLTDNATFFRANEGIFRLPAGYPWSQMFDAVLLVNGPDHRRRRKVLAPVFHSNVLDHYQEVFSRTFRNSKLASRDSGTFDMVAEFQAIARANMLICLLGLEPEASNLGLAEDVSNLLDNMFSPSIMMFRHYGSWTPYGRWARRVADAYQRLCAIIERRRSEDPGWDVLSILCHTVDDRGRRLTNAEIAGELHGLFAAGYETTASAMSWSMLTCLSSPSLNPEDVDAVINETQRLIPTLPILLPRKVTRDVSIDASPVVPRGAVVVVSPLLEHRNPDIFPDPHVFRPGRWRDFRPSPYAFLPFGIGQRRCIGARFAELQVRTTLSLALDCIAWQLLTTHVDYGMTSGIISLPMRPIWIRRALSSSPVKLTGSVTRLWRWLD